MDNININHPVSDDHDDKEGIDIRIDANTHHDRSITLKLYNDTAEFDINELKLLSYFDALLSKRWMQHRKYIDPIVLNDNSSNNNNSNNNNLIQFGFGDIKTLIKCAKIGKIPDDIKLDGGKLDGLINANEYLMNCNDSIIDEKSLFNYLYCSKPRIRHTERQILLKKTNNNFLKYVLNKFDKKVKDMNGLFCKKFKLEIDDGEDNAEINEISIDIVNFTNKNEYENIWNECEYDDRLSICNEIARMINIISTNENINKMLFIAHKDKEQEELIDHIISDMINGDMLDLSIINIDYVLLGITRWRIKHNGWNCPWYHNAQDTYTGYLEKLKQLNNNLNYNKFTNYILNNLKDNFIFANEYWNVCTCRRGKEKYFKRSERKTYYELLKNCLIGCSEDFIIGKPKKWFPKIHKNDDNNSHKWVLNTLIKNVSIESKCKFGIYLTKFAFRLNTKKYTFPKEYIEFLKKVQ